MLARKLIVGMVLLVCIGVVVPIRATTYYVDPNGSDDANGLSLETPFETIQKAADTMEAGDTVYIKEGTYVEMVTPKNSGSAGNWITYQAYPGDEVIIESPNSVWSDYCIILTEPYHLEYLHFKNLTLKGVGQEVTTACFKATGNTQGGGVKSHIILEKMTMTNAYHGVAFRYGVTDSNIIDCNISYNGNGISFVDAIRNILISGNHISYSYADPDVNSNGDGIAINGHYGPDQNPDSNMCSDITIANNLIHDVNRQGVLILSSKNVLVRGNHCHHNGATGIQIESAFPIYPISRNIVVEDNLCEDNAGEHNSETGIWVDDSNDVLVQNNILRRNQIGLELTGTFHVIARNNIIYENSRSDYSRTAGIMVYESSQRGACENNIIVHNTLYRNAGTYNGALSQVVIGRSDANLQADNAVFKNNISSRSLASRYCEYLDLWVYGLNPELNYNNYYQPVKPLHVCWQSEAGEVNVISWSEYLSSSGQDSNSITSDPCFINPNTLVDQNNADFHLRPGSECVDAGAFLTTTAAGGSGTLLVVADSRYFSDGYGLIDGDLISVGSNPVVMVLDVNYDTNTLCVDQNLSWNAGDGVSYAYLGSSPDIGAYEYGPMVYNTSQKTSYECVQPAIDDANNGDEIVVYPGTYYGAIDFNGKAITLCGANPSDWDVVEATVIDGNGATNTVTFGTDSGATLSGLTIIGGGRGAHCTGGAPVISRCIIRNDSNGITASGGSPTITNCIIKDNGEQGIYAEDAAITVKNSIIYDNNEGITLQSVTGSVRNNTIVNNTSYGIQADEGNVPAISNCIFWNNGGDLNNCSATYSCIQDCNDVNGTNHNICSDPCFVDADSDDFHLGFYSLCINTGDPDGNYADEVDIDGEARVMDDRVEMGADEAGFPLPDPFPNAHYWKLDETSGTIAYDSVNNNNGTFNGNDPCWAVGKFGGAVDLNGVSDYFSVPTLDTDYNSNDTFAVAGWFNTSKSTGMQTIVGRWCHYMPMPYVTIYSGWQVLVENKKVVARFDLGTSTSDITGTSDVNDGDWHHFALVYPTYNANAVLYVDGDQEGTPGKKNCGMLFTKFRIGDGSYVQGSGSPVMKGGKFDGMIDDVMIFDCALTADEVEELYERGL